MWNGHSQIEFVCVIFVGLCVLLIFFVCFPIMFCKVQIPRIFTIFARLKRWMISLSTYYFLLELRRKSSYYPLKYKFKPIGKIASNFMVYFRLWKCWGFRLIFLIMPLTNEKNYVVSEAWKLLYWIKLETVGF